MSQKYIYFHFDEAIWQNLSKLKINISGYFPAVQWLRRHLPMQGAWVQTLVRELRSLLAKGQGVIAPSSNWLGAFKGVI